MSVKVLDRSQTVHETPICAIGIMGFKDGTFQLTTDLPNGDIRFAIGLMKAALVELENNMKERQGVLEQKKVLLVSNG